MAAFVDLMIKYQPYLKRKSGNKYLDKIPKKYNCAAYLSVYQIEVLSVYLSTVIVYRNIKRKGH